MRAVGERQHGHPPSENSIRRSVHGMAQGGGPVSQGPTRRQGACCEVLLPLLNEVARPAVRGVAHPIQVLVHWQVVRIEVPTEIVLTGPYIEAELHSRSNVLIELIQIQPRHTMQLHAIDDPPDIVRGPLVRVIVELRADRTRTNVALVTVRARVPIDQIQAQIALTILEANLFIVELVPIYIVLP